MDFLWINFLWKLTTSGASWPLWSNTLYVQILVLWVDMTKRWCEAVNAHIKHPEDHWSYKCEMGWDRRRPGSSYPTIYKAARDPMTKYVIQAKLHFSGSRPGDFAVWRLRPTVSHLVSSLLWVQTSFPACAVATGRWKPLAPSPDSTRTKQLSWGFKLHLPPPPSQATRA